MKFMGMKGIKAMARSLPALQSLEVFDSDSISEASSYIVPAGSGTWLADNKRRRGCRVGHSFAEDDPIAGLQMIQYTHVLRID